MLLEFKYWVIQYGGLLTDINIIVQSNKLIMTKWVFQLSQLRGNSVPLL
jgi:hypothetical protein